MTSDVDPDKPQLDDVLVPTEPVHPDHREHGKQGEHLDEQELDARARHEQRQVHND